MSDLYRRLTRLIHGDRDPYTHYQVMPYSMHTWADDFHVLDEVMDEIRPRYVIELGSWMGGSALRMLCSAPRDCVVLCVDTWRGQTEWCLSEKGRKNMLPLVPTSYDQFLSNVDLGGCRDRVVPFPATTEMAMHVLKNSNTAGPKLDMTKSLPDMILIDACHKPAAVKRDLLDSWPLLRAGGMCVMHDWDSVDVRSAVEYTIAGRGSDCGLMVDDFRERGMYVTFKKPGYREESDGSIVYGYLNVDTGSGKFEIHDGPPPLQEKPE